MLKNLVNYYNGEEFKNVEVLENADDLPRGCGEEACILDEKTYERYVIYKDCVTGFLYAVPDN